MFWDIFFLALIFFLAIPIFVFFLEVFVAFLLYSPKTIKEQTQTLIATRDIEQMRTAILIPAHNEETSISVTVKNCLAQLKESDSLIVIADNCTDKTAFIASQSGATAIERNDLSNIGKGYALDFGLKHLSDSPPDIIIIIDADCTLGENLIKTISTLSFLKDRPVQAHDIMEYNETQLTIKQKIVSFAWRVKNYVRPLGLKYLGLPCQLMGTGMAFPYKLLQSIQLGSSNIVEDLQIGIDLTKAGYPAIFCPSVEVRSLFPTTGSHAEVSQRKRWEHGHLSMIFKNVPHLLLTSLFRQKLKLFSLAMDLSVPPLALLSLLLFLLLLANSIFVLLGLVSPYTLMLSILLLLLLTIAVFLSWYKFAKDCLTLTDLIMVPFYILKKIPLYFSFINSRQKKWVRTDRNTK